VIPGIEKESGNKKSGFGLKSEDETTVPVEGDGEDS
jgi:hypothetical protein